MFILPTFQKVSNYKVTCQRANHRVNYEGNPLEIHGNFHAYILHASNHSKENQTKLVKISFQRKSIHFGWF